jgi:exodeoxyribonuclease III
MKILSWNVNGLRAIIKKGALRALLDAEKPDLLCLQETKINSAGVKSEGIEAQFPDYAQFYSFAARPGYSGTAIWIRGYQFVLSPPSDFPNRVDQNAEETSHSNFSEHFISPVKKSDYPKSKNLSERSESFFDLDEKKTFLHSRANDRSENYCDWLPLKDPLDEGRLTALDLKDFYLISVYVPNAKQDLSRLDLRKNDWGPFLRKTVESLEKTKPVLIAGDFNVAHEPIDLARPKENEGKHGYTTEEREDFTKLLASADLLDTFRTLHPEKAAYTWWSHWGNARANNVGWRIDYALASKTLLPKISSANILPTHLGSDHCPIGITLNV